MNNISSDEIENEKSAEDHIWTHKKSVGKRTSSLHGMQVERKEFIRQALEFDIIDIRSYTGYRGDLLIEITTMKLDVAKTLKKIAESLGMEAVIQKDVLLMYKIYCISKPEHLYEFKEIF